jgi:hypothetical protein
LPAQRVLEPPDVAVERDHLLAQPDHVARGRQVGQVQRLARGTLHLALRLRSRPQREPHDVGEALGLHGLLETRADRSLDAVEQPPPQRLPRHRRLLAPPLSSVRLHLP